MLPNWASGDISVLNGETGQELRRIKASSGARALAIFGAIDEYAYGTAVIRAESRTDVIVPLAGSVTAVVVEPGQRVEAGQPLVRFHDALERAQVETIQREHDEALFRSLREQAPPELREQLTDIRARLKLAQAKLALRTINAPHAGYVSDVRIRSALLAVVRPRTPPRT